MTRRRLVFSLSVLRRQQKPFQKLLASALSLSLLLSPVTFNSYAIDQKRAAPAKSDPVDKLTRQSASQIKETLNKTDLHFEENAGQLGRSVKFASHTGNRTFLLTGNSIELVSRPKVARAATREDFINQHALLRREEGATSKEVSQNLEKVQLRFANANANPQVKGLNVLSSKSHYLIGRDNKQWKQDIAHYAKVKYQNLYPGIDLLYYGNQNQLEYDFVVSPGVNPEQIKIAVTGTKSIRLSENGDLMFGTGENVMVQRKPVAYQEIASIKHPVSSRYKLLGNNQVGFELGDYDSAHELVIDPILGFATTFGTADDTYGNGIATDLAGNSYITGIAYSVRTQAIGRAGIANVFVTKLNSAGQLVYTTYIGGSGEDVGFAIDVDRDGSAYVTGHADTNTFPITTGAFQTRFGGIYDAFVLKLTPRGNELAYSSFLGGGMEDTGTGIAVDRNGQAYVVGETMSSDFPAVAPLYRFGQAPTEAFVSKVSSTGTRLIYSTALTGSSTNRQGGTAAMGVDVTRRGDVVVAGFTTSERFPRVNALQDTLSGPIDAFVTRINRNGNQVDFSTYLGGSGEDAAFAVALDAAESAYITGLTNSTNYPTVNALQPFLGGSRVSTIAPELTPPAPTGRDDAFVTKLISSGNAVAYSTFLGGSQGDVGFGIAVNNVGEAHVVGRTRSTDFPTEDPLPAAIAAESLSGGIDGFACKLQANGRALIYSDFLGDRGEEKAFGVAVWGNRTANITGLTTSIGWLPNNLAPPKLANAASAFALQIIGSANFSIASVSGASYERAAVACDSIVSLFGQGVSSATESADSFPLPNELGGIKVLLKDSAGVEFQTQIFFASPFQINYHIPAEAATGPATIRVVNENGDIFTENTQIERIAPGLFTADASGKGLVAGYLTRVKAGKVVGDEPIARINAQGQLEALPIDLGAEDEEVFLVLFGTGIRHRNPSAAVTVKVSDVDAPVLYAGRQSDYVGLDQVNLRVPRNLKGRGMSTISLTVEGKTGNEVQVYFK